MARHHGDQCLPRLVMGNSEDEKTDTFVGFDAIHPVNNYSVMLGQFLVFLVYSVGRDFRKIAPV